MKEYPRYDLLVIGSGPAGKAAAIQAAKLGRRVAVVDGRPEVGGVCVHTGTIPSKTMRETVLNLTGWRERGFYGRAYRVKQDIDASDLMRRLSITLQREVEILQHQLTRNGVDVIVGFAGFDDNETVTVTPPAATRSRSMPTSASSPWARKPTAPTTYPSTGSPCWTATRY